MIARLYTPVVSLTDPKSVDVQIVENLKIQGAIFRSVRKKHGVYANTVAENLKNPVS